MCKTLLSHEKPRSELIHSAIHQFTVFEISAEMNNKYDISNFARSLETFDPEKELSKIRQLLESPYVPKIKQPKFDFVEYCASGDQKFTDLI